MKLLGDVFSKSIIVLLIVNMLVIFPNQLSQLPPPFPTVDENTVDTKTKKKKKKKKRQKIKNTADARKI